MISSMACLRAKIYGIKIPEKSRSEETKMVIAEMALQAKV